MIAAMPSGARSSICSNCNLRQDLCKKLLTPCNHSFAQNCPLKKSARKVSLGHFVQFCSGFRYVTRSKSALFVESVQAHGKRCKSPEKHRFLKNRRINDKHLVFATFVSQSDAIATRYIHPGQQAKEQNINTDFSKTRCVHPIFRKCAFPDCCGVFCMLQRARHTVSNLCISQILRPETVGKVCPRAGRFGTSGGAQQRRG